MVYLFLLLIVGFIIGWTLRKKIFCIKIFKEILIYTIYILLFTIGMSVGKNSNIIKNIYVLGFDALIISIFGVLGSISIAFLVYKFILKK